MPPTLIAHMQTKFNTPHDEAFIALGALKPGRHWSAFDVPRTKARKGLAKIFITTIWNFRNVVVENGRYVERGLTISQDRNDGSLWYRMGKPGLNEKGINWKAHWNGLQLALKSGIPIVGLLKDRLTGNCSLESLFDIDSSRVDSAGADLWLRLLPRAEVGCAVAVIDISKVLIPQYENPKFSRLEADFNISVVEALKSSQAARLERLANAPKLPNKVSALTTSYVRNPDVVAEALFRANGICGICNLKGPFIRKVGGKIYLEVHHKKQLSKGGEDTIENVVAVCPNCHRHEHYA